MSDGHQKLPPKKEVALALLEGPSMFVHLDPRRAGVLIPLKFRDKPQLVLQIGLNMFVPITDLQVDDEGITCTLSFDRSPFWCRMPWSAVYALVGEDGRGMMWPNDIPPEVVAQMQNPTQPQGKAKEAKPQPQQRSPRPKLSAVGSSKQPEREAEPEEAPPESAQTELKAASGHPSDNEPLEKPSDAQVKKPSGASTGRKPKRELPPYLRVIK